MGISSLNPLQRDLLTDFFKHPTGFFLTGGAALSGFYLHHRETQDLDLFTTEDELEAGAAQVLAVAGKLGCSVESLQTSPEFRRFLFRRGEEAVVVDLVRDRSPQVLPEKPVVDGVRLDPLAEILANKLCALLSRAEVRDLVDVRAMEKAGLRLEDGLRDAARKDAGLTPGQLGWVLSQITLGDDLSPPGHVTKEELGKYLENLIRRLTRMAYPDG